MTPGIQNWYGGSYYYDEPETAVAPSVSAEAEATPGWKTRPGGAVGLILGRFLPLHRGHQYLIELALAQVERLVVGVRWQPDDPYPWKRRRRWLQSMFPQVTPVCLEGLELPADFRSVDRLFSGEERDRRVAEQLGVGFTLVDRTRLPISATRIREDVLAHWDDLPAQVAADLVRPVRVLGSEGSGKSTLCQKLARHFGSQWVPEAAAELAQQAGGRLRPADLVEWAQRHLAAVQAMRSQARGWLFLDTDLLSVALWGERMWGGCPDWIRPLAAGQYYAKTLVLEPRVKGLTARQRQERLEMHQSLLRELPTDTEVLQGTWKDQWSRALQLLGKF